MSFLYAKYGKVLLVGEGAVLMGSYYVYHNLTVDKKYRERMTEVKGVSMSFVVPPWSKHRADPSKTL